MLWIDLNKYSIYFFITFQDFSFIHMSKDIQIISSYYIDPFVAFILHIVPRGLGNIFVCYCVRKIISPLPHNLHFMIYCFIFILFFIPIPLKGYILILLSLFQMSLPVVLILIALASLPSSLCQVLCQKVFEFNDYKLSLIIGIMSIISFIFYILLMEKKTIQEYLSNLNIQIFFKEKYNRNKGEKNYVYNINRRR